MSVLAIVSHLSRLTDVLSSVCRQEFKALLSGSGGLRQRLEKAVAASQSLKEAQAKRTEVKPAAPQAPAATIKLSMDFSNFT